MDSSLDHFLALAVALSIGLLIGIERGWHERDRSEGRRIAGIRTFGLIGLLGGLWALLGQQLGTVLLGIAFAVLAMLLIIAHLKDVQIDRDLGITTVIAALVTFALGALAMEGYLALSAAGAVVTTTLLSLKPVLHRWLKNLQTKELYSGIKLLLISVVVLPVLPDKGFGPWQSLNPYNIWWMVVLIAGISFAAYISMQLVGTKKGLLMTGFLGGLASSTATTLYLSHLAKEQVLLKLAAGGIILAAATMFPRVFVEIMVVNHQLLPLVWLPLLSMSLAAILGIILMRPWHSMAGNIKPVLINNPMEFWPAFKFGLLLALIMLLSKALLYWLGDSGIYLLAALSGLADVDAITLSLANMAQSEIQPRLASQAIIMAVIVNTLVKAVLASWVCGLGMAKWVWPVFGLITACGLLSMLLI